MAKGLAPIFFTACGVVVAGIVGYTILEPNFNNEATPLVSSESSTEVGNESETASEPEVQETAKLDTSEEEAKPEANSEEQVEPIKVEPVKPTFDVVRVEKDGSTVIAGQGPAGHVVELIDGDKKLTETTINSTGEFVFVLDKPLEPGAHELFLRALPKEGDAVQSSSFAFVDVPKPNTIGDVTVLLAESGKPSQILQKTESEPTTPETVEVAEAEQPKKESVEEEVFETEPKEEEVASEEVKEVEEETANNEVTATAEESVSVAKPEESTEESTEEIAETEAKTEEEASVEVAKQDEEPAVETPAVEVPVKPVLIEAADVEAGKIFIAGTGEPKSTINIYLENQFLGSVNVADNGAFLFEGEKDISAGRYDIRADMTKGGADVLARAEVKLVHEPKVVEVAKVVEPEPEPTPEPVVKPEPTTPAQNETESVEAESEPEVKPEEPEADAEVEVSTEPEPTIETAEEPKSEPESEQEVAAVVEEVESEVAVEEAEPVEQETVEVEAPKKEIQTGSAVIIRRGDNLWTVARRNYGAGIRYTTIFEANRDQIRNPHLIYPGQVFKVPEDERSVE